MEHITQTPTAKAPAERFTGDVYLSMIETPVEPARLATALVRFTPGARTNWHETRTAPPPDVRIQPPTPSLSHDVSTPSRGLPPGVHFWAENRAAAPRRSAGRGPGALPALRSLQP
ncbi:hypothetical protein AB0H45_28985 [Streptomyces atroolivaceus]|uniref:hypothetical protein n=1 Tax=Streptomyces atroolivaceus TaxID=66869 RepID=UPI0033D54342